MSEVHEVGDPINHRMVGVLGLVTICTYGGWYYAFGVLFDPIAIDTGWSESTLAASFSIGLVLVGVGSLAGGRFLDRVGHRLVFSIAAMATSAGFWTASFATNQLLFAVGAAWGMGACGALGFYHVTMATAVRFHPTNAERAIAILTIWGAFASVIFLPLTAWLIDVLDWRSTVRILAVSQASAFVLAAALEPPDAAQDDVRDQPQATITPLRSVLRQTIRRGEARRFTTAVGLAGIAMSTMLVYQVPAMTAAGLPIGTAAAMAGLRGFAQLGGRLPLDLMVRRLGIDRSLLIALGSVGSAGVLLTFSGSVSVALAFALIAGFGIGAFSPLQGIKSEQLFDRSDLGTTMGFYSAVLLVSGAVGPVAAGVLAERGGDRRWAGVIIAVGGLGAAAAARRPTGGRPEAAT